MVQMDKKTYGASKDRLEKLFDAGTFVEIGAYLKRSEAQSEPVGVVCGYGAVRGTLTFAFVQDSARMKGAFGERQAKKIASLYALAVKNGAPVVGVFDSAGAVVYDGVSALAAYGSLMKQISEASGIVPQIAVIDGVCGGAAAVAASMFDFVVTVQGSSELFINAPFTIGKAEGASVLGLSAKDAENEDEAFAFVKTLLSTLPQNNADAVSTEAFDDLNRKVAVSADYDVDALLASLSDGGVFTAIYRDYAENARFGFASFGGVVTGVIACDPKKKGMLDMKMARAASKLISFCDAFSIPVLTLVDSEGLAASNDAENAAFASELARLAMAYTSSECAKVTVVLGKAYGTAYTLLGSKSVGADLAFALPTACISVLSPEASVAFVWNDRVGEVSREELEKEWKETCASAASACDAGEIDDLIDPSELRQRICASLLMLSAKAEGTPVRKHTALPL